MSISIKQQQNTLTALYNKNPFVIKSTNIDEDNFYYLFYVNDSDGTIASLRVPSSPNGYGLIDANNITKNNVSYNFNPTPTTAESNPGCFYQYKISYGSISDGTYDNPVSTDIINGYNFVQQLDEQIDLTEYFLNDDDKQFLTDFNDIDIVLTRSDYYTFSYINGTYTYLMSEGQTHPYSFVFKFYKTDGTMEGKTISNSTANPTIDTSTYLVNPEYGIMSVGVGVQNLINTTFYDSTTIDLAFFDDVEYYTIRAENYLYKTKESKEYTVRLKCEGYAENYQIFYLNKLGSFDAITFTTSNEKSTQIKTTTFETDPYHLNDDGTYTYSEGNRGVKTLDKTINKSLSVKSDLVVENQKPIYEAFQYSPVHILFKNGKQTPLNLKNSTMKLVDKTAHKMYQIKYTFEYSNKNKINV